MSLPPSVDTVVVGAGQAGLVMSRYLQAAGRDHLVLERRTQPGGGWRDRWDDFCLVTPNWTASFPGMPYDGPDPDGFMSRDEIAGRVARYASVIRAPVALGTGVRRMSLRATGGFHLETDDGLLDARQVVVATGGFHVPRVPALADALPRTLTQLHAHGYRNERALPPGAVLVVGSGQSGVQLAEELMEAGRRVFLAVGSAGRMPRRYRGRDAFRWLAAVARQGGPLGIHLPTVDELPDPRLRLVGNPHVSGHHGGHDTNLRKQALEGLTLLGHLERVDGTRLGFTPDLPVNLARADRFFDERFRPIVDAFIARAGVDAPPDDREQVAYEPPVLEELDLAAAGITTVLWTCGYRCDYGWIDLPVTDAQGLPRQRRGVGEVPGLFFLGSLWQHSQVSATLLGPATEVAGVGTAMGLPPRVVGEA